MKATLRMLSVREAAAYWPECAEILRPAFRYRAQVDGVDDYREPIERGDMQLWVAQDGLELLGALITVIEQGSQAKVCTILKLAGKDLERWIALVDEAVCAFAKANRCIGVQAITRKGFSRYVPDFVEDGCVYVKILGE